MWFEILIDALIPSPPPSIVIIIGLYLSRGSYTAQAHDIYGDRND